MLVEIRCDAFKSHGKPRPPITFHGGLNTVLGASDGSNSIGKSTFLLIVDFAFGGSDYIKSDAVRNVGSHTIEFAFKFGETMKYYARETTDSEQVRICNKNYEVIDTVSRKQFCEELFTLYAIDLPGISFRGIVSRYFRIYGRDNLHEKRPLHAAAGESAEKAITALLKLFNKYDLFEKYKAVEKEYITKRDTFKAAQKYEFIPNITTKKQYTENERTLESLKKELALLIDRADKEISENDLDKTDIAIDYKGRLATARRHRSRLKSQLRAIEINVEQGIIPGESDLADLALFFPEANIKKVAEIESFHQRMKEVLHTEFEEERQRINALIESVDQEISQIEDDQRKLGIPVRLSKSFLDKYSELNGQIKSLDKQNASYTELQTLKADVKVAADRLADVQEQELRFLENDINVQMAKYNDFIYDGTHKPPIIDLKSTKSYLFETPDDTGTGASYKSLVVFDLSILTLTPLPALAHDSAIFKNIGDAPVEKIMELYLQSSKQIFIALDKDDSYTEKTAKILNDTAVLRLSGEGNELFGRSWNIKQ